MTTHKAARHYGDQMQCSRCGKSWDVNDPDPPECEDIGTPAGKITVIGPADRIAQLRELFKDK